MELASMLAGEPFSDNPVSVCPVIGSFLRAYNDAIDDDRRKDLYEYASRVVGSRASEAVQRARAERLADWTVGRQRRRWTRALARAALRRPRPDPNQPFQTPGAHAVRAIRRHTDETHAQALALVDELLEIHVDPHRGPRPCAQHTRTSAAAVAPGGREAAPPPAG
jgi:hypothetical protein